MKNLFNRLRRAHAKKQEVPEPVKELQVFESTITIKCLVKAEDRDEALQITGQWMDSKRLIYSRNPQFSQSVISCEPYVEPPLFILGDHE